MKPIKTRNYRKCYHLFLLPTEVIDDAEHYLPQSNEIATYFHKLVSFLKYTAVNEGDHMAQYARLRNIRTNGGLLMSLQIKNVLIDDHDMDPTWSLLDLNYLSEKSVKLFIGDESKPVALSNDAKALTDLENIMGELYTAHDNFNGGESSGDTFIEELYLVDDIDLAVDGDSNFVVNFDPSLRDYLIDLNSKLK